MVVAALAAAVVALSPAAGALAAPAAAQVHTADSPGSIGIRLVDVPVEAQDDPRALQYIVDQLNPGVTIERRVELSNSTDAPLAVEVYAASASITDGVFRGDPGRSVNALSSWISLSEDDVVIPAGGTVVDTVTIVVPADAAPGEQYGAVWVQASAEAEPGGISAVNRVGIRMYLAVGGANAAASAFTVDTLTASRDDYGNAVVTAQLHNTGGRALDASGSLTLTNATGTISAGPYTSDGATTLAPGDSAPIEITLGDDVDDGPWNATLEVTSGLLAESFNAELTFPEAGTAEPVIAHAEQFPLWLAVLLAIGTLLVATIAAAVVVRVVKRRAATAAAPPRERVDG
jgi:hypothetical protein